MHLVQLVNKVIVRGEEARPQGPPRQFARAGRQKGRQANGTPDALGEPRGTRITKRKELLGDISETYLRVSALPRFHIPKYDLIIYYIT